MANGYAFVAWPGVLVYPLFQKLFGDGSDELSPYFLLS
jgi:hypothetical protein